MDTGYFCSFCQVPIIGDRCEICGNPSHTPKIPLKTSPVFKEELQMLAKVTGEPVDEFNSLELWTTNRDYYFDGQKIFKLVGGNFIENPKIEWLKNIGRVLKKLEEIQRLTEEEHRKRIKEANRFAIGTLEEKAIRFIRTTVERFNNEVMYNAVSFSGGKDSTVVSYLVRKALGSNGIFHIFTDTSLENPDTLNYVKDFAKQVFLLKAEPQQSFASLVEKALFPSRMHRWCCTALKIAPIGNLLKQILEPGAKILMFEGARHEESLTRQEYEPVDLHFKIASEIIARPILTWSSLEEWIYILAMNLPINQSYRKGMIRVGCSLCPLSRPYSEFLMEYWSNEDPSYHKTWENMKEVLLQDLQRRGIKDNDLREYLKEGKWKGRAGGSVAIESHKLAELSDWQEEYEFIHIELNRTVNLSIFREYFKPLIKKYRFDFFESQRAQKTIFLMSKEQKVVCKIIIEGKILYLWWFGHNNKQFLQFSVDLKKQLIKYQFCSYCGACQVKCAFQAIETDAKKQVYIVNSALCTGCGECININKVGCLLAKSVKTTNSYKMEMAEEND